MYNISYINQSNNFFELVSGVNTASEGVLFPTILLSLFIIVFIASKRYDTIVAMINASATTSLFAVLIFFAGLISWQIMVIPIVLLVMSIAASVFQGG